MIFMGSELDARFQQLYIRPKEQEYEQQREKELERQKERHMNTLQNGGADPVVNHGENAFKELEMIQHREPQEVSASVELRNELKLEIGDLVDLQHPLSRQWKLA